MDSQPTPTPHDLDDNIVVTDDQLAVLEHRLLDGATRYFPHLSSSDSLRVRIQRYGEVSSYPLYGADFFEGGQSRCVASVVVKFAPVFSDNNEGLTEYKHMGQMYSALGPDGPLRVPRPLDFYDDVNALLMEKVGGERFSRVMLRDCSRRARPEQTARMSQAVEWCGQWLSAYHKTTEAGSVHPFDDGFQEAVNGKLSAFESLGFPKKVSAIVRHTLDELSRFGETVRVMSSDQHGDYGPQNVHLARDHIVVFDLNYHKSSVVYDDVGYFLVTLETLNPLPRHPWFDRRRAMALRKPFLRGYFGTDPAREQEAILAGHYIKSLLFRCGKQRRNVAKRGRMMTRWFDATRVRSYYPNKIRAQCDAVSRLLQRLRYEVNS